MKKHLLFLATLFVSASLAHAQQAGTGGAAQTSGTGQTGGATQSGVTTPSSGLTPAQSQSQPGTVSPTDPAQPGVGTREGTIFNQPAGANQPQPRPFGGTNQIQFGNTNQALPGTVPGGATRFGTNTGTINDPSGAAANQAGIAPTNLPPTDQAFALQMRSVLARPGATQIFFPQTRSTVTVMNQNGALVLRGFVTSEQEKQSIETRIQNTPGVVSIDNQLQVGGQQQQVAPRTPGINPAPNSQIPEQERRLLNP